MLSHGSHQTAHRILGRWSVQRNDLPRGDKDAVVSRALKIAHFMHRSVVFPLWAIELNTCPLASSKL